MVSDKAQALLESLPILEPLTQATKNTLKPFALNRRDYLEIDLDSRGDRFVIEACVYQDGIRTDRTPSYNAATKWVSKVPEAYQPKGWPYGRWLMAGTDFTAIVIAHQWPSDRLKFKTPEARTLYEFLLMRFLVQTKNAVLAADFKKNEVVPEAPQDFIEHPDPDLRLSPYQKAGTFISYNTNAYAFFMQQGTGKTPMAIERMCMEGRRKRREKGEMLWVLVLCPKQARTNWEDEIERFATSGGKVAVARGDQFRRIKAIQDAVRPEDDCDFGCCIASYESIDRSWNAFGMVPWDLAIMDESHYIKWHGTKRFQMACRLREISEKRLILTGTPVTNTPFDLWSQWEFLNNGLSGFMVFKNFRKFYGKFERNQGSSIERLMALRNLPLIQERLARTSFSITKEEAKLNLPPKTYDAYEVSMTEKQRKYYKMLVKQLAIEIEEDEAEGKELTAEHILTKLMRLAQITSGFVKWDNKIDPNTGETIELGQIEQIDKAENAKASALMEILNVDYENDPNSKTLVWATFIEDVRAICERLTKEGIKFVAYHKVVKGDGRVKDAEEAKKVFNGDPDVRVFVGNPASAGEALNMVGYDYESDNPAPTYAGRVVYFSQNWSAVQRSQSEDRAHRRGTRGNVQITDLVVPGTIDQEIRERVVMKRKIADMTLDVRDILDRVLNVDLEAQD